MLGAVCKATGSLEALTEGKLDSCGCSVRSVITGDPSAIIDAPSLGCERFFFGFGAGGGCSYEPRGW